MEKEKSSKIKMIYYIPFVLQVIIHIAASGGFVQHGLENIRFSIFLGGLITVISMLMGEGYGAMAFIVAGYYDRIGYYVAVIIFSIIGMCANFVGLMITGIEGKECLWMTVVFWCIDLFLIIFSIIRTAKLSSHKNN